MHKLGNGECDIWGGYNTEACGWDGGDCNGPSSPISPSVSTNPPSLQTIDYPSFSPTALFDDSNQREKQNRESYVTCIDTTTIWESNWQLAMVRVSSFEEARDQCESYDYMTFSCPTKFGVDYDYFNDMKDYVPETRYDNFFIIY